MATLKQRVHRFNGTDYDTIHYETSSACVLLSNGNYLSSYESRLTSPETIANGGTGQTTASDAVHALTNGATTVTSLNNNYYIPLSTGQYGRKVSLGALAKYFNIAPPGWDSITLGKEVQYGNKTWTVVHKDNTNLYVYLMLKDIYSTTAFGSNTTYSGSTLSTVAGNFESSLGSDFKSKLVSVTCKSITRKVFVPTYSHLFGTNSSYDSTAFDQMHFDYFPSHTDASTTRIGNYNGSAQYWWTSSAYDSSNVWTVSTDGSGIDSYYYRPTHPDGFRPFVCLNFNA